MNHINIIGAGAIGKALAVLLQRVGKTVTLIRGSVEDGHTTTQRVHLGIQDRMLTEDLSVVTLRTLDTLEGLIVVTIKSFGNEALARALSAKAGNAPIVLLQNGLGIEAPFLNLHYPNLYRCVLYVTSQTLEDHIRFKPVAPSPIGVVQGDPNLLPQITEALTTPDFLFVPDPTIKRTVWHKAILNTVFNSICPLVDVDNGVFHREESALNVARGIIFSCLRVAAAEGLQLDAKELEASLLTISKASDQQLISTLQDIRMGRNTEIDTLNFAIASIAHLHQLSHEVREVLLLGELTRLKATIHKRAV